VCVCYSPSILTFLLQAEDGIRDRNVTGVQTCALPISSSTSPPAIPPAASPSSTSGNGSSSPATPATEIPSSPPPARKSRSRGWIDRKSGVQGKGAETRGRAKLTNDRKRRTRTRGREDV